MLATAARLAVAAVVAMLLYPPSPSVAATRTELTRYVDRVAAVWAGRQDGRGFFRDPRTGQPQGGYGNVMIGYGLLRAGARASDDALIRAGVRGVSTALSEPPSARGAFDLLGMAAAYNFARTHLLANASFTASRRRWERYLRETGAPNADNKAQACIVAPDCFHNHEAVGATADLELLATGVRSRRSPGELRRSALQEVGVAEPSFAAGGLLSDSGVWPLAYHALSTAMLGRAIQLLGPRAPAASRLAFGRTTAALRAFMAPDGTVAYIGRRQEDLWSLAAAVAAAEMQGDEPPADRAFARIEHRYPLTGRGLPIVPRSGRGAFSPRGVDGKPMTFNGLAIYLLNVAADSAPAIAPHGGRPLRADRDGTGFVDDAENGFATVRHGNVWFAVHRRRLPPDLRNDFGLVAAKWRSAGGLWIDILRPRPMRFDAGETAGPVIERGGQVLFPYGDSIALRRGGVAEVRGRIGSDPATFRYTPLVRGVQLTMKAQPGDVVVYTAFGPTGETRVRHGTVSYASGVVTARPRPDAIRLDPGFASCCDVRMVAARMRVRARGNGIVTFRILAHGTRRPPPAPRAAAPSNGSPHWWLGPLAAVAAVVLAATARRRNVVRRRRRPWRTRV